MKNSGKLRAYLQSEKEKIKDLTLSQKIHYILGYYWLWILGIVCALAFAGYVIYHAGFSVKDYWFYGMYANTAENGGNGSELWRDFVSYGGYDTRVKKVEMDASSWFDPSKKGGTNNSYYQAFTALTETGTLDVVVLGTEGLKGIGSSGRLLDLRDDSCAALAKRYRDRLVYAVPYDEEYSSEPVPVGIDLSDSLLVTKYHLYEEEIALGISAYTTRLPAVETFLRFILPEED